MVYSTKLRSIAASGLLAGTAAAAGGCSAPDGGVLTLGVDDVFDISSCKTFEGSIAISEETWGSISLDGVEEITGSLIVDSTETLTYFSADSLSSIGSLELSNAPLFTGFDLPALNKIESLSLSSLPLLWEVDFGSTIEECSTVEIRDTYLTSIELEVLEPEKIIIEENDFLWSVSVASTSCDEISIGGNTNAVDISFPSLESAKQVSISNATGLSFPSLTSIEESITITDSWLETFDFSTLETIGGSLEISGVWDLDSLSLSSLKSVGGDLKISDCGFSTIAFESLESVEGDLSFDLSSLSDFTFDSLTSVGGSWDISGSPSATFSCSDFSSIVAGDVSCDEASDEPSAPASASTTPHRSTPVASLPTDLASTPSLTVPSSVFVPATPVPTTPAAVLTPGPSTPGAAGSPPRPSSVISSEEILTETLRNGSTVTLTSWTPVATVPVVATTPGGGAAATPSNPTVPYEGAAAGVMSPVVGGVAGLVSAVVLFCLL
ncbi:gpi-anchored cell wall organization protein ecm33 [Diplodia corticola]|uniref:Gpi-anchored cell wall organization protein ecm33 n=1 Tax=Diplodia corticola TaxID=236234 RepID=A0A1J9S0M9_9PEZI|nr:gpi-anchored cell wall organization protein ecm33 [Diplodia corticola]OJD33221.1 gpi-anchored cell wall organization protein ecm33 [Diplodia corticola]